MQLEHIERQAIFNNQQSLRVQEDFCNPNSPQKTISVETIEGVCRALTKDSPVSFFLSTGWIKNWLYSLPESVDVCFVQLTQGASVTAAFFLGAQKITRHFFFQSKSLFFNATGIPLIDNLCIEYNSPLGRIHDVGQVQSALVLLQRKWDEIHLPAMDSDAMRALTSGLRGYRVLLDRSEPSYFVDLKSSAHEPGGYLGQLSANTRSQIRRIYRKVEQCYGKVSIGVASDLPTAMDYFENLMILHQHAWEKRGQAGVFASRYFVDFHRKLIETRLNHGEIQLLQVTAGDVVLAYLYNFIFKNQVLFYQSGVNYTIDNSIKPGILAQVEAINFNMNAGYDDYDFLGGDAQYKKSLSTGMRKLYWSRIQKPLWRFSLENNLKEIKAKYFFSSLSLKNMRGKFLRRFFGR